MIRRVAPSNWVDLWPYLVVTACVAWAWHPTLQGIAHIPYDLEFFHFPLIDSVQRFYIGAVLPSWDPDTYGGVPLLANAQSAFAYPPHLMLTAYYAVAGGDLSNHVLSLVSIVHVWIAGLGMVALVRARGWGNASAAVGGAFVTVCGFVVLESQHLGMAESLAWLPWAVLCVDRAAGQITWWRVTGIAACFFLVLSAGFLPMVIPWALTLLALAAARSHGARRAIVATVGGMVLGVLLGAVVLLPIYALRNYFPPLEPYNTHLLPTLVSAIYPNAFGYWASPAAAGEAKYAIGDYMYIGAAGIVLVPLALARGRAVLAEATVAAAVLVLSIGPVGEHVAGWIQAIPTVGNLYRPALLLYTGAVPCALLVARGLERHPTWRGLGLLALVLVALTVIPIGDSQGHSLHLIASAPRRELFVIALLSVALAAIALRAPPPRAAAVVMAGIAIAAAAELTSTVPARFFTNSPGPGTTVTSAGDLPLVARLRTLLRPGDRVIVDASNMSAQWAGFSPLYGLPDANGFQPQFSRYQQARLSVLSTGASWRTAIEGNSAFSGRILPVTPAELPYFREMGVRYVIGSLLIDHFSKHRGFTRLFSAGPDAVWRVESPAARAWVLRTACLPQAREGVTAGPGCVVADAGTTMVNPHARRYAVPGTGARTLIAGEPYYPGWSAWAGGRSLAVRRLGYLAAVTVPPSVKTVTMDYVSPGLLPGLVVSGLTLLALLAGGIVASLRSRRRELTLRT